MGKKRTVSKRPRTGTSAEDHERRSKFREDPLHQQERDEGTSSRQPSMQMRQVMSGRRILFNFLDEIDLHIGDRIEEQGWEDFCSLNVPTYPTLVRRFYENLKIKDDVIESHVRGRKIVLSEELISSLFKMPHVGSKFLELEDKPRALEAIQGTYSEKGTIIASTLSLEMRLLHNFISRIFIPRSGRFDWVSERDLAFMEKVVNGEPINLPYIMMTQIKETTRKTNTCLPYGMAFTVIFEAAHINLSGEDKREPHHTDTYTAKSLKRMGYIKINGEWKKKDQIGRAHV